MALKLPLSIISSQDVHRALRELEALDSYIHQNKLRKKKVTKPRVTITLEELLGLNKIDIQKDKAVSDFYEELQGYLQTAPQIHISFAIEPSVAVVQKILSWMRDNINQGVLLQVGLQPTIAAGCVIRTRNKVFDFSLRQHLLSNQKLLADILRKKDVLGQGASS